MTAGPCLECGHPAHRPDRCPVRYLDARQCPCGLPGAGGGLVSFADAIAELFTRPASEVFRFEGTIDEWAAHLARADQAREEHLAAAGIVPVSVVHGDPETAADADLIFGRLHAAAQAAGHYSTTIGGNDYTTWYFDGPHAERDALAFIAAADGLARPWWIITRTASPRFHRDHEEGDPS
jgi:hypothetical protein